MKKFVNFLSVLVFLTFISVNAKSQYAGIEIISGTFGNMDGENSCNYNVGYNEVVLPFCIFKESFIFTFPPSPNPRELRIRTYDQNLTIVATEECTLPAYFTYCSFVSTTYVLGIGIITMG